ncbi:MAG: hypothetical protein QOK29_702, partial [Rhodospirillaceae bacterium]|nr:hypothetical protein [Rhodospirillaceae bacterium]
AIGTRPTILNFLSRIDSDGPVDYNLE